MRNPVPATVAGSGRNDLPPVSSLKPCPPFVPLCTRPVALAITTVTDELGRPLVGAFVPDGELL